MNKCPKCKAEIRTEVCPFCEADSTEKAEKKATKKPKDE